MSFGPLKGAGAKDPWGNPLPAAPSPVSPVLPGPSDVTPFDTAPAAPSFDPAYNPAVSPTPSKSVGQRRARRVALAVASLLLGVALIYLAARVWTSWQSRAVLGFVAFLALLTALVAGFAALSGRQWETAWGDRNGLFVLCPSGVAGVWWQEVAAVGNSYVWNPQSSTDPDLQTSEESTDVFLRSDEPLRRHPELRAHVVDEALPPAAFLHDLHGYLTDLPTRRLRFARTQTTDLGLSFDYPGVRNLWNDYPRPGPWGLPPNQKPFAPDGPDAAVRLHEQSRREL